MIVNIIFENNKKLNKNGSGHRFGFENVSKILKKRWLLWIKNNAKINENDKENEDIENRIYDYLLFLLYYF